MDNPLIEAWTEAVGGRKAIERARTIYTRSRLEGLGLEGSLEEWATADGNFRQDLDLGGVYKTQKIFRRREGTAWFVDPNGKVQAFSGEMLRDHLTDVYLATFSHLARGRLPGGARAMDAEEAAACDAVELEPEGGAAVTYYLDRRTHLPVRSEQSIADAKRVTRYEDWRDVDGIKMPFHMRQDLGDPQSEMDVLVEDVRINSTFDEGLFDRPVDTAADVRFDGESTTTRFPIELNWNHVFVHVRINDSDPRLLLLDTGAQVTAIDARVAGELGIEGVGEFEGRGAGEGTAQAQLAKDVSFRLPGVELVSQTVGVMALADLVNRFTGVPMHGVLGYDFVSRFVTAIDYVNGQLTLCDPEHFRYSGSGEMIPISLNNGIPTIRAKVEPFGSDAIEAVFIVDTGASDALYLTRPFVEAHNLLDTLTEKVRMTVPGVGGESTQTVGRVERLTIGSQVIDNPVTFLAHDTSGAFANPDFAGVIGAEVLGRFDVIFDYSRECMILDKNGRFDEQFEFDKSGINLIAEGPDLRTYRIRSIIEGSPADEAGLHVGDVIVELDGKAAGELTLPEVTALFYRGGRGLAIRVRRGDETIDADVLLRRLI